MSPAAYLAPCGRSGSRPSAASGRSADDAGARASRGGRRQLELARAYGALPGAADANGCIDFGDQVSLALRLVRESPAARAEIQARFRYILVDEFQDTNRAQSELVAILAERAPERDGRRRRRPVDLPVPGRGDQQHPRVPRAVSGGARRSSCAGTTARSRRRSSTRPIGSSGSTIRTGSRSQAGIDKRLVAERGATPAPGGRSGTRPIRPAARRRTGSRRRSPARIAAGTRPRDVAILVRANGHAEPILRSLDAAGVPWRFSGTVRPVCPARGPAAARVPPGDRRPRLVASTSTPWRRRRAVRARRRRT